MAREEERVDLQPGEMLPTASDIAARYETSLFGHSPPSVNFPSPMYDWTNSKGGLASVGHFMRRDEQVVF